MTIDTEQHLVLPLIGDNPAETLDRLAIEGWRVRCSLGPMQVGHQLMPTNAPRVVPALLLVREAVAQLTPKGGAKEGENLQHAET